MIERKVRVRFAPSPTGYLHFGGLYAGFASKLTAETTNGVFMLRIEDTDIERNVVGGEELIDSVAAGNINFDRVIATPDMMPKMSKIARVLGPKGLMPNPKLGTVTNNVAEAVATAKAGQIEYRAEKKGIIHAGIGKMSFETAKLVENAVALIDQLKKIKPASAKGQYILGISVATTQGPGLKVDAK